MKLSDLIGNPDCYAIQKEDGSWLPQDRPLDHSILAAHKDGSLTAGTYVLYGDKARTLVFDLDSENARLGADEIKAALEDLGVPEECIGIEFSGRKGYHVWVILGGMVPASELRRIGRATLALAGVDCEVFPKQDSAVKYGNLIKLPMGVHRVTGKRNDWVTPPKRKLGKGEYQNLLSALPPEPTKVRGTGYDPFPCLATIQDGISEGGRNNALFHLAVMLRRGGLAEENLVEVLHRTNAKNEPPMSDSEVDTIIESSKTSGPLCSTMPDDLHCGDACIVKRAAGLVVKPGQVRHAAPGQNVVVTCTNRVGKLVELDHPDAVQMKGVLA